LLFRVGDVPQLAAAISRLYGAPDLAFAMGSEAREYVRDNHSPETHYAKLLKIYTELSESPECARKKTRPLRVAFIGGRGVISKYSGIETYYEQVGEQLARRGHEVTIYCHS
jgi:hypothetical protein